MWKIFLEFSLDLSLPLGPIVICKFIEYLFVKKLKPTSIQTYLSAISYGLEIREIEDFTQAKLVKIMMRGARHIRPTGDLRIPIGKDMLFQIISYLEFHGQIYIL